MAIWLVRAGSHGEYERKFISDNKVYVTADNLDVNLKGLASRNDLVAVMTQRYPDAKTKTVINWAGQAWPFAHDMKKGDLVVMPLKTQPAINIGEITGDYQFELEGHNPFYHWRQVKWIGEAIPRLTLHRTCCTASVHS